MKFIGSVLKFCKVCLCVSFGCGALFGCLVYWFSCIVFWKSFKFFESGLTVFFSFFFVGGVFVWCVRWGGFGVFGGVFVLGGCCFWGEAEVCGFW